MSQYFTIIILRNWLYYDYCESTTIILIIFKSNINIKILLIGGLHRSLKYYETIHSTHFQHRIVKRGIQYSYHPYNKISELEFYSHGR